MDLQCPYCHGELEVNLEWVGPPYLQSQVVDEIACSEADCFASWDPKGHQISSAYLEDQD